MSMSILQSLKDDIDSQTPTGLATIDHGSLCPSVWPVFQPHYSYLIQSISQGYKDVVRNSKEGFAGVQYCFLLIYKARHFIIGDSQVGQVWFSLINPCWLLPVTLYFMPKNCFQKRCTLPDVLNLGWKASSSELFFFFFYIDMAFGFFQYAEAYCSCYKLIKCLSITSASSFKILEYLWICPDGLVCPTYLSSPSFIFLCFGQYLSPVNSSVLSRDQEGLWATKTKARKVLLPKFYPWPLAQWPVAVRSGKFCWILILLPIYL